MSEYDYSPEAYQRHIETQERISRWVDNTQANAHRFRRPVPSRTDSSDSIVTVKEAHGQMPYPYYQSGPPTQAMHQIHPLSAGAIPPPPPPPQQHFPMQYATYPGPIPTIVAPTPSMQMQPPPPATSPAPPPPIIYQPAPVAPPPQLFMIKQPSRHSSTRSSRKLSKHPKQRYAAIIHSPPPSPLVSPPPGSYQSFTPLYQNGPKSYATAQRGYKVYYV